MTNTNATNTTFNRSNSQDGIAPIHERARNQSQYLDFGDEGRDPHQIMGEQHEYEEAPDAIGLSQMSFDADVADKFENTVISRQVPGYHQMRVRALHSAMWCLERMVENGYSAEDGRINVTDLGTSTGLMLRDIMLAVAQHQDPDIWYRFISTMTMTGIDNEEAMIFNARGTTARDAAIGGVEDWAQSAISYHEMDLTEPHAIANIAPSLHDSSKLSLITCILTLQFFPPEQRPAMLRDMYESLHEGGALILCEKVLGRSYQEESLWTKLYYDEKARNGMSKEDIAKKRRTIERILIPVTHNSLLELLEGAGFHPQNIISVWKDLSFECLVALK